MEERTALEAARRFVRFLLWEVFFSFLFTRFIVGLFQGGPFMCFLCFWFGVCSFFSTGVTAVVTYELPRNVTALTYEVLVRKVPEFYLCRRSAAEVPPNLPTRPFFMNFKIFE